jgi:uncharacterized protein (DUF1697 family)
MKYISLLRGINVSGQKMIKMDTLIALYQSLNLINVSSYIQSGNIIFESQNPDIPELIQKLEEKINEVFNFTVTVIIRTVDEFDEIIRQNPFGENEIENLYIVFLSDLPSDSALNNLSETKSATEQLMIFKKEIYLFCHNGYGKAKFNNNYFEKKLNIKATTRNWKTVNKLYELASNS